MTITSKLAKFWTADTPFREEFTHSILQILRSSSCNTTTPWWAALSLYEHRKSLESCCAQWEQNAEICDKLVKRIILHWQSDTNEKNWQHLVLDQRKAAFQNECLECSEKHSIKMMMCYMSRLYNIGTTDVAMVLVGCAPCKAFWSARRTPLTWEEQVAETAYQLRERDPLNRKIIDACLNPDKTTNGHLHEENMMRILLRVFNESDILREDAVANQQCHDYGRPKATPDVVFRTTQNIFERSVRWIEFKNAFVCPGVTPASQHTKIQDQIMRYTDEWPNSHGIVVWNHPFFEGFASHDRVLHVFCK